MSQSVTKVFFDCEFTGLHKDTTLISIGLVAETGERFYAELNNYDNEQLNEWLEENVMANLWCKSEVNELNTPDYYYWGDTDFVAEKLKQWLLQFNKVEMWSDCLAYDWVLFCDLYGHEFYIPSSVSYIPMDISTMFNLCDIDPDINREDFVGISEADKHNALHDAMVIKACYEKMKSVFRGVSLCM